MHIVNGVQYLRHYKMSFINRMGEIVSVVNDYKKDKIDAGDAFHKIQEIIER